MAARKGNKYATRERKRLSPLERFLSYCRFEAETGCVLWAGDTTCGRGNHIPYGSFWFSGRRWFAHRWAARYIHNLDIDNFHVDHCCPNIPIPNTLCVAHLQCRTARDNSLLMHERRKAFIHLQVGLVEYSALYGHDPGAAALQDAVPFYEPPTWFGTTQGLTDETSCPF